MSSTAPASLASLTADTLLVSTFERLRGRLVAMVERRVGPRLAVKVDPEGVVQEAYQRARERWSNLDLGGASIEAWVYTQVHDRLVERVRAARGATRDVDREFPWDGDGENGVAGLLVDTHTGPEAALSRAERREIVQAALGWLKPIDREVLDLRYVEGLEFEAIGAIVGLSANTVNHRALRALKKLKDLIPPEFRPTRGRTP